MITNEYPQYIKSNFPNINISPIYNVVDENFNGLHKKVERKIIGYSIYQ